MSLVDCNRCATERVVPSFCYIDYILSVVKGICHTTVSDLFPFFFILKKEHRFEGKYL